MGLSRYAAGRFLQHMLGDSAWTMPSNVYVALYTATPSDTGGGTEVTGGSYARVRCDASTWANPVLGSPTRQTNETAITFPIATASWGTIVAFGIFDASSSGNLLGFGTLSSSVRVDTGQVASFAAGDLTSTAE